LALEFVDHLPLNVWNDGLKKEADNLGGYGEIYHLFPESGAIGGELRGSRLSFGVRFLGHFDFRLQWPHEPVQDIQIGD
jgi:hypothetical protein